MESIEADANITQMPNLNFFHFPNTISHCDVRGASVPKKRQHRLLECYGAKVKTGRWTARRIPLVEAFEDPTIVEPGECRWPGTDYNNPVPTTARAKRRQAWKNIKDSNAAPWFRCHCSWCASSRLRIGEGPEARFVLRTELEEGEAEARECRRCFEPYIRPQVLHSEEWDESGYDESDAEDAAQEWVDDRWGKLVDDAIEEWYAKRKEWNSITGWDTCSDRDERPGCGSATPSTIGDWENVYEADTIQEDEDWDTLSSCTL
ncbi:hypothetical protein BDZ91DRAFT_757580 [Kalaharituber pfeilii]|nr:hypothetical protein BDZ91DRAFT_757580 [Kalaharituber pfeilii]